MKRHRWTTPEEATLAEGRYWRGRSVGERVSAVETIRQATVGIYDEAPARMERTYRLVDLPPRPVPDRGRTRAGSARPSQSHAGSRHPGRALGGKRKKLGAALADFGYRSLAKEWQKFSERDRMATLGREPLRVDIMTSISGVDFVTAWKGRVRARHGKRIVGFLGRRELIRNKRAAGRTKDLLDLALLDEIED